MVAKSKLFLTKPKKILTRRFILRPIHVEDATRRYLKWLSDREARRHITTAGKTRSLPELRKYLKQFIKLPDCLFLKILERKKTIHIGNIKYHPIWPENGTAIMGILVGEPAWRGKGVAAEVIKASSRWLKNHWGINQIYLGVKNDNQRAQRAYCKFGFRETNSFPMAVKKQRNTSVMFFRH